MIIDVSVRTTAKLDCLKGKGVDGIIRYYARETGKPQKVLTRAEAEAITGAGIKIGVVHQSKGDEAKFFSREIGSKDGAHARAHGGGKIGQPAGSTIYFAVDYDASEADVSTRIVPHFEGVRDALAAPSPLPRYEMGAYGSGLVCRTLLDLGLVKHTWISQSKKFRGTPAFTQSKRWTLLQHLPSKLCGLDVDVDDSNGSEFGAFAALDPLGGAPAAAATVTATAGAAGGAQSFVEFVNALNLKHFKPYELLVMGDRHGDPHSPCHGLNTMPPRELWPNIVPTVRLLDQLRERLAAPIRITNVYRSPAYNTCIGGAKASQHTRFCALDFHAEGGSRPVDWAKMLRSMRDTENLFRGGVGLYSSFVHVDTRGTNADW